MGRYQGKTYKMNEILKMLFANIKANIWCIFHLRYCVLWKYRNGGKQIRIEVGSGSLLTQSWKTKKIFYDSEVTTEGN
jgi:hypothetical protein